MNTLNYKTSRDYARLVELMKRQSVICIIPWDGACQTAFDPYDLRFRFSIRAGVARVVSAFAESDFIAQCKAANVEFIEPDLDANNPTETRDNG
jgi:hypothetical protein